MTTPPPDLQPAPETLEVIAERITAEVAKICGRAWESCTRTRTETKAAILSALRNERDRCAKIAEFHDATHGNMHFGSCAKAIAGQIRGLHEISR